MQNIRLAHVHKIYIQYNKVTNDNNALKGGESATIAYNFSQNEYMGIAAFSTIHTA